MREQALRDAERARRDAAREAERIRRRAEHDEPRDAPRQRPLAPQPPTPPRPGAREAPRGPNFSYSFATGDAYVVQASSGGAADWTRALSGWRQGASALERSIGDADDVRELAALTRAAESMAQALDGIGASATEWAQSRTERRIVREALQGAREVLDGLRADLADAHDDCE